MEVASHRDVAIAVVGFSSRRFTTNAVAAGYSYGSLHLHLQLHSLTIGPLVATGASQLKVSAIFDTQTVAVAIPGSTTYSHCSV